MHDAFRVHLLGPVAIEQGTQPLNGIKSHKALALLAYLAVQETPVTRGHLAALLWQHLPEDRARANLSWTLHYLSDLLPGALYTTRHAVSCQPSPDLWLDVHDFQRLASSIDPHCMAQAAALYRGEFGDGIDLHDCQEYEIWRVGECERWRLRMVDLLRRLAAAHQRSRAWPAATETLHRLLLLEPWAEDAHRNLMRIQTETGQRAAALAQYAVCCQALRQELDVEVSPETTALYRRIRAGETLAPLTGQAEATWPDAIPLEAPPPAPIHNLPRQFTPFIGRRDELARLTAALAAPTCALLVVSGPAGVGKTRLAVETAQASLYDFPDGVWFVPAQNRVSSQALVVALAEALGLTLTEGANAQSQLLDFLAGRRLLLLLDGLEETTGCPEKKDTDSHGGVLSLSKG